MSFRFLFPSLVKFGFSSHGYLSSCIIPLLYLLVLLRFMEDLQAEVQEMEFLQFSKGMDTMRREDFAEWLLHYTNEEDNDIYWDNMRKRIPAGQVRGHLLSEACCENVV